MTCLPPKIAMITLLNSHTHPSWTFWHLEHYTFSVLRNDPKFAESRGLFPLPRTQTTEYEIQQYLGRQATPISYNIKSSFKAKRDRFFGNSEIHSFPQSWKDAASHGSDNLPITRHMCEQDFFCLPDKQEDCTAYSLRGDEAREVLRLQLLQKWKLQLPWSLYRLCSPACH